MDGIHGMEALFQAFFSSTSHPCLFSFLQNPCCHWHKLQWDYRPGRHWREHLQPYTTWESAAFHDILSDVRTLPAGDGVGLNSSLAFGLTLRLIKLWMSEVSHNYSTPQHWSLHACGHACGPAILNIHQFVIDNHWDCVPMCRCHCSLGRKNFSATRSGSSQFRGDWNCVVWDAECQVDTVTTHQPASRPTPGEAPSYLYVTRKMWLRLQYMLPIKSLSPYLWQSFRDLSANQAHFEALSDKWWKPEWQ